MINFYALDAAGNLGYNDIVVNKDTSFPDITIISPIPYQLHGKSAINYELLINELNLYNTWYTLNDGIDYEFVGLNGTINQIAWDSCSNGSVNIKFFANNTAGNLAFKEINVFKDILAPNIIVFYPIENDVYGNKAFSFDLSMLDGNLDSKWYSLNDGLNYTFSGDSGTVNQNAWEAFGNGQVIVKFYANDSLGNLGYKEIKVIRDINNPEITINNPSHDEKFYGEAPNYDISIVEPNLESMWYTIDDGVINFTIIQLSGAINQAAWDATPYGNITIRFYAKDLAGNIAYNEIFVEKVEIRGEEPVVYGYNLIIFISLLSVITVISLKKKNNSI